MNLSPADRRVVMSLCPFPLEEVAEADVTRILDTWFAQDHYDDNPAYTWSDEGNESDRT
jgi:hypothetical protein